MVPTVLSEINGIAYALVKNKARYKEKIFSSYDYFNLSLVSRHPKVITAKHILL